MQLTSVLNQIDHLVYVVPDLLLGMDFIEKNLGVRPVFGGRHPNFGTHNALLGIGGERYLEVIAPDPNPDTTNFTLPFQMAEMDGPRLATWAFRTEEIDELALRLAKQGIDVGEIFSGSRTKPDGSILQWKLSDPNRMMLDGVVPFLISWGDSLHPTTSLPMGPPLVDFYLEHPEPERVRQIMGCFGVEVVVVREEKAGVQMVFGEY